MPSEGIRQRDGAAPRRPFSTGDLEVRGQTVRIRLAGILDRRSLRRLMVEADRHLYGRNRLLILDGSRLLHLDYRCVPMLLQWGRGLRSFGHRLYLANWNEYLSAILAMEDWDGELEQGALRAPATAAPGLPRRLQVP
jgi:ABC-type transporter Mla MlaB component